MNSVFRIHPCGKWDLCVSNTRSILYTFNMDHLTTCLRELGLRVATLSGSEVGSVSPFTSMDEAELSASIRAIADLRGHVDQLTALAAGEVAERSRRQLGHQGMAQKAGFVSPTAMFQSMAQVSKHEATRMIEMGGLLHGVAASNRSLKATGSVSSTIDTSSPDAGPMTSSELVPEWHTLLANALAEGRMSIDKVDAIRRVMADIGSDRNGVHEASTPDVTVTDAAIARTVVELIAHSTGLNPEQMFRAAKRARDAIDADGIERREKEQRDLRSVRTWWDVNGMHCGSWRLAPEDGALVAEAFAQILSPRRGGPRFVDSHAKATAEELIGDERSDEQITADAFCDMMRLAVDADPGTLFGHRRPAVRVLITAERLTRPASLTGGTGASAPSSERATFGHIEGRGDSVSQATIDRHLCDTGAINIGFDTDGQCVNVGRNQRLFTERQRIGLAARDGGCLFPGCERPPSYCEAHHIDPWKEKHGKTDVADGVLLCRRHHLLIHNNRWQVSRTAARYFLTPPPDIDPSRTPIAMPSTGAAAETLYRERQFA